MRPSASAILEEFRKPPVGTRINECFPARSLRLSHCSGGIVGASDLPVNLDRSSGGPENDPSWTWLESAIPSMLRMGCVEVGCTGTLRYGFCSALLRNSQGDTGSFACHNPRFSARAACSQAG